MTAVPVDQTPHRIETVVMDMAGTTVVDDGLVVEAFTRAWDRGAESADVANTDAADPAARAVAVAWVEETMGQSKIEVFRHLLPGDEAAAQALNARFEGAFDELVAEGRAVEVPGAGDVLRALAADGRTVVLTTGFARGTADAIVGSLGWGELAAHVLTPADAGRGRPAPDLNLTALLRSRASAVSALAVVGDTEADARSGVAAGAGLVVGVLTGASTDAALRAAGAHEVLPSVADLPDLLARLGR